MKILKTYKQFEEFEIKQFKDIEWYNPDVYPMTMGDYVHVELDQDFFKKYEDEEDCDDFKFFITNTPGKIVQFYGTTHISLEYPFDEITWQTYYLTYDKDIEQYFFLCNVNDVVFSSNNKTDVERNIKRKNQAKKFNL